ncbi:MAG: transglycosylase family protein [Frankiaceae bacterium]
MHVVKTAATITAAGIFGAAATGLALATPRTDLTLDVDGHSRSVSTSAQTVGALLDSKHVSHGAGTRVTPGLDTALQDNERIEVDHPRKITAKADAKTGTPPTAARATPAPAAGTRPAAPANTPTQQATPAASAAPAATAAPAASAGMSSTWAQVAQCETGGNPGIVAGQFYGMYMMTLDAWHAAGGTGLPSQASASEQTARAQTLYNQLGSKPWPVCGKYLP